MAKFNKFEIRKIGNAYEIVKWNENNSFHSTCFTVGYLIWDKKNEGFDFKSCGIRYLQHREEGLEEWILAWCKMKEIEYKYKEDDE